MKLSGARVVVDRRVARDRRRARRPSWRAAARASLLVARSADPLEKLAAELGGEAFPADLADASAIEPLVRAIEADGPIDVLVNNAGVDLTGDLASTPGRGDRTARRGQPRRADAAVPGRAPGDARHAAAATSSTCRRSRARTRCPGSRRTRRRRPGSATSPPALRAELKGTRGHDDARADRPGREHDDRIVRANEPHPPRAARGSNGCSSRSISRWRWWSTHWPIGDRAREAPRPAAEARRVVPSDRRGAAPPHRTSPGGCAMTIPRTIDDITPEWLSDALGRTVTGVTLRARRRRCRARRPAVPAPAGRRGRALDRRREARRAHRRRPLRRDRPQHVRP